MYVVYEVITPDSSVDGCEVVFHGMFRERWQAIMESELLKCDWAEVEVRE